MKTPYFPCWRSRLAPLGRRTVRPLRQATLAQLQEHLQGRRLPLPKYSLIATEGEAHAQQFRIACTIEALQIRSEGSGSSRRGAEQMAAERALERLQQP